MIALSLMIQTLHVLQFMGLSKLFSLMGVRLERGGVVELKAYSLI